MPATSSVDMGVRIASLTSVWAIAAAMAIITIFIVLRSPLLGALVKSIRGFLSALLTGNIIGLLEYITYYTAVRMSLLTAGIAIYFGTMVGKAIVVDSPIAVALSSFGALAGPIGPAVSMLLVIVFALAVCWPAFRIQGKNGKMRKASVLAVIIMIPFMAADAISERLQDLHVKVYGEQRGSLLNGKIMRNSRKNKAEIQRRNQAAKQESQASRSTVAKIGSEAAKLGLHGAAAAATGGASIGASAAMLKAGAATKAGQLAAGTVGKSIVSGIGKSQTMQSLVKSPIGKRVADVVGERVTGKKVSEIEPSSSRSIRDTGQSGTSSTQSSGSTPQPAAPARPQVGASSDSITRSDIDRVVEAIDTQTSAANKTTEAVNQAASDNSTDTSSRRSSTGRPTSAQEMRPIIRDNRSDLQSE